MLYGNLIKFWRIEKMKKIIKRVFKQIWLWLNWSYYLRCKHCCLGCKYFDNCLSEVESIENNIDIDHYFD